MTDTGDTSHQRQHILSIATLFIACVTAVLDTRYVSCGCGEHVVPDVCDTAELSAVMTQLSCQQEHAQQALQEQLHMTVMCASGLGDIAVPGLLACLALRYDASRATNMRARADAAAEALKGAFSQIDVSCHLLALWHTA